MTDWYDTVSARQVHFQARSVVGGVYVKMLTDEAMWRKWSSAKTIESGSKTIAPGATAAFR